MSAPPLSDPAVVVACSQLTAALPTEIDPGITRRPVTGDPARTAAWGDPPVTLECGVPAPERPDPPVVVNGVRWSIRDTGPGFRWTTSGRTVYVAVTIAKSYPNGAELVLPLSDPVTSALPVDPNASPEPGLG